MLKREDALKTVVKFTTRNFKKIVGEDGIEQETSYIDVGTGFFMKRDNDNQHLYIITASHVSKGFNNSTIIEMMGGNNSIRKVSLFKLQNGSDVIYHPFADVCAIEIDIDVFNSLNVDIVVFGTSLIDANNLVNISRDVELTSIGFPNGLGTHDRFEPLTFRSFPSSSLMLNMEGLDGGYKSDIFILENPSCGGYSGGPVLDLGNKVSYGLVQSSPTYFYGLMHGTISDNTGGKFAVVTPATYILQII